MASAQMVSMARSVDHTRVRAQQREQLAADDRVRALDVVVDGLADVVQQSRGARVGGIHAQLGGEHGAEVPGLLAVEQRVLSVRETVMQGAEQLGHLGAAGDAHFPHRPLAQIGDPAGQAGAGLQQQRGHLLGAQAALQHLQRRLAGHLAADGVERAQGGLVALGVDAEVGAGVGGHRAERIEQALARLLGQRLQGERAAARGGVDVGAVLALDGVDDQLLGGGGPLADPRLDGTADPTRVVGGQLALDAVEHGARGAVAADRGQALQLGHGQGALGVEGEALGLDLIARPLDGIAPLVDRLAALAVDSLAAVEPRLDLVDVGAAEVELLQRLLPGGHGVVAGLGNALDGGLARLGQGAALGARGVADSTGAAGGGGGAEAAHQGADGPDCDHDGDGGKDDFHDAVQSS
jgi:hypothetical protein